jgi:hypothetical protein
LITLDLGENCIEEKGAQYIDDVLQKNKVNFFLLFIFILILSLRHSSHWSLKAIKLALKELNIWLML